MKKTLSRRDFIKLMGMGAVGAAVVLFAPAIFRKSSSSQVDGVKLSATDFLHFDAAPFGIDVGVSHPLELMEPFNFMFTTQIWGGPKKMKETDGMLGKK